MLQWGKNKIFTKSFFFFGGGGGGGGGGEEAGNFGGEAPLPTG